jgi:ferredoxin
VHADLVHYGWLAAAEDLAIDGFVRPVNSVKSFFLPPQERLFAFQGQGRHVALVPMSLPLARQVVLAARPCDAAALPILDHVFNWDYHDTFFNRRRELTTVVTLACRQHDEHCFCTSVGLGPDSTDGADVLLVPARDDLLEVRYVTEKGRELLEQWTVESEEEGAAGPGPELCFDLPRVRERLAGDVQELEWQRLTRSCLGCGACAHNCPTCHCFDIVDQTTHDGGYRVRNWDTCQTALYSQHASGHNPRAHQSQRQRNRITHKFQTYPEKFGPLLCTGCGACGRNCAVGLGLRPILQQLAAEQPLPSDVTKRSPPRQCAAVKGAH